MLDLGPAEDGRNAGAQTSVGGSSSGDSETMKGVGRLAEEWKKLDVHRQVHEMSEEDEGDLLDGVGRKWWLG